MKKSESRCSWLGLPIIQSIVSLTRHFNISEILRLKHVKVFFFFFFFFFFRHQLQFDSSHVQKSSLGGGNEYCPCMDSGSLEPKVCEVPDQLFMNSFSMCSQKSGVS